jgi:hypothetical protein
LVSVRTCYVFLHFVMVTVWRLPVLLQLMNELVERDIYYKIEFNHYVLTFDDPI